MQPTQKLVSLLSYDRHNSRYLLEHITNDCGNNSGSCKTEVMLMRNGSIFIINEDNTLLKMDETSYDSEEILQKLLDSYPDLLPAIK